MNSYRLLIDTNVLIALEDPGPTDFLAADLARRCQSGGITIFVHEDTRSDFSRDPDLARREISRSRINKYPTLSNIPMPDVEHLEHLFGSIRNENDRVDVALLFALSMNAVDVLISQDSGVHKRVRGGDLEGRVLTIADAVEWLRSLQDPIDDGLRQVVDLPAYSISLNDPIFASLKGDYEDFDDWWRSRCVAEHRRCWVLNGARGVDGLIVRKSETGSAIGLAECKKVLKLCTFKVAPQARGYKVGELLLRKALWHAQLNNFDALYLTTFTKQAMLIDLLTRYGFTEQARLKNGELVFVKTMSRSRLTVPANVRRDEYSRLNYPRFSVVDPVRLYAVPVQWPFHRLLFPECALLAPLPLFPHAAFDDRGMKLTAGNTIRKVYVCRSRNARLSGGDVLFFYQSKDVAAQHSQCLTTIGVVEQARTAKGSHELIRLTAGRSVFSRKALEDLAASAPEGVTVIDFLLVGHLEPAVTLAELTKTRVLKAAPQSITRIGPQSIDSLRRSMNFGFAL